WTPSGFIGQMFKTVGRHVPPPAGLVSPAMWGVEDYLRQLFGAEAASIRAQPRTFNFRYASPAHMIQIFRDYYGPVFKAFGALDAAGRQALEQDLTALIAGANTAGEGALVVPAEYLDAIIIKRTPEVLH
ncbi:SAM-dependent methyltransferase, partial [Halobellus sp. Atlit-31R]